MTYGSAHVIGAVETYMMTNMIRCS